MSDWLARLFCHCHHKWRILVQHPVKQFSADENPVSVLYVLQCEKCGDVKSRKVP